MYPGGWPALRRDLLREYGGLTDERIERLGDLDIAQLLNVKVKQGEAQPPAKTATAREVFFATWRWRKKTDAEIEILWQQSLAESKKQRGRPDANSNRGPARQGQPGRGTRQR